MPAVRLQALLHRQPQRRHRNTTRTSSGTLGLALQQHLHRRTRGHVLLRLGSFQVRSTPTRWLRPQRCAPPRRRLRLQPSAAARAIPCTTPTAGMTDGYNSSTTPTYPNTPLTVATTTSDTAPMPPQPPPPPLHQQAWASVRPEAAAAPTPAPAPGVAGPMQHHGAPSELLPAPCRTPFADCASATTASAATDPPPAADAAYTCFMDWSTTAGFVLGTSCPWSVREHEAGYVLGAGSGGGSSWAQGAEVQQGCGAAQTQQQQHGCLVQASSLLSPSISVNGLLQQDSQVLALACQLAAWDDHQQAAAPPELPAAAPPPAAAPAAAASSSATTIDWYIWNG